MLCFWISSANAVRIPLWNYWHWKLASYFGIRLRVIITNNFSSHWRYRATPDDLKNSNTFVTSWHRFRGYHLRKSDYNKSVILFPFLMHWRTWQDSTVSKYNCCFLMTDWNAKVYQSKLCCQYCAVTGHHQYIFEGWDEIWHVDGCWRVSVLVFFMKFESMWAWGTCVIVIYIYSCAKKPWNLVSKSVGGYNERIDVRTYIQTDRQSVRPWKFRGF